MDKIGIMQGRVIPESFDNLQIFPVSNWEEELIAIKEIGFDYVEVLFDKKLVCKRLLSNPQYIGRLSTNYSGDAEIPMANSMCIDYIASISATGAAKAFCSVITNIIEIVKNIQIKVLVIPFFNENSVCSSEKFEDVLSLFKEFELNNFACANNILLTLELNLPAREIRAALENGKFKNIKICYDVGNARAMGYSPEDEIVELGDFIHHLHIKDRKVNGPNVMLGEGDVNFKACFKSLKKIGYKGIMVLETNYGDSPAIDAAKNLQFVKNLLKEI